jgi:hypothetical protein
MWTGACQNGFAQGQAVMQWFLGDTRTERYEGEVRDGKLNGRGIYTFPSGDRYEGEFRDGKYNGRGVYTSKDGERLTGLWRDDSFIEGRPSTVQRRGTEIPLQRQGGTFVVPVKINNALTLNFTIDSGASDVSIPADVVMTLIRLGTITSADFLGKATYRLADGRTIPSTRFVIRNLKVGDREIDNVTGSIADVEGGLLLGQTFLSRFQSWSVDNRRQMLVLE